MRLILILASCLLALPFQTIADEASTSRYFESIKDKPPFLRTFLQAMPKGGDLHNHLVGAIYAETLLNWAAEDGLCVDMVVPAILQPGSGGDCRGEGLLTADQVKADDQALRRLVNGLSTRSFVASPGWSGHNQFFATFVRMGFDPKRLADMVIATANRAGRQNILYLELMVTTELPEIIELTSLMPMPPNSDIAEAERRLRAGGFGRRLAALVASTKAQYDAVDARKNELLKCGTPAAEPGCDVEVRYLYQVIRSMPPMTVLAQSMLGYALANADSRVVGLNFVTPEDGQVALRDYHLQMQMLRHLRTTMGDVNLTLHAGELAMGLVRPDHLKFHIRDAIETAGAKRIGHGVAIPFEENSPELLEKMAREKILVEINLTSNDVILGIAGDDHPFSLYRAAGVPMAFSTDDEGVSRIDLTHEYQRAVETYALTYADLKAFSRNSISYSFLQDGEKQQLLANLAARYATFEAEINRFPKP